MGAEQCAVPTVVHDAPAACLPACGAQLERWDERADTLFLPQLVRDNGTLDTTRETVGRMYVRLEQADSLRQKGRRVRVALHSFATLVVESGSDILTASELLDHVPIAATPVYVKARPER